MKPLAFIKRSNGSHWVGDGFPVKNIFSYQDIAAEMSPFLLMDYAGPTEFPPTEQRLGVGPHPHRGFETVTLVYAGGVSHRDSAGGGGTIGPGDVQWMTAGSGVLHEEFHSPEYAHQGGPFEMVQLWVNLPAHAKMTAPAYQAIVAADIPEVDLPGRAGRARIVAGQFDAARPETRGPARSFTPMNVWDLRLEAGRHASLDLPEGHGAALFVLRGELRIAATHRVREAELAVFERQGRSLDFETRADSVVLLLSGEPLDEPIVGRGPFVMNSEDEIRQAYADFRAGHFGAFTA